MKSDDSRLMFVRNRDALDASVTIFGTLMDLSTVEDGGHYLLITYGQCFLNGIGWPNRTGNNGFEVWKGQSTGFFVLFS